MNLHDYFETVPYGEIGAKEKDIADFLGCHESLIKHYKNGTRRITPAKAIKLEQYDRRFSRSDLLPNIFNPSIEAA